ncbi:protein kinase C substrate 80K-H S homeolog precursor [Xenopus laevis]|uniref:Glucosidase 2 subunit beta n=1 Tax=Xenopus laevis TaxID=8355 RepID=Q6GLZ2_XENLA|nr:protein kinase C substrate 80K-H S homeolog precursor [Xenopus laevis]AAH74301.1 MGC84105 protein [Xenopus laevis]
MKASLVLLLLGALGCWAVEVKRPRGVSLSNRGFYDDSKPFTCLDGSRTIPFDRVNDDYCDCADGTDEPGTSACSNGRFHCTNAGYKPQYIPSSRINDGICDCCDTTDEYNSGVVCENTCREMGRKAREELQVQAETAREGFRVKQLLIEEARKGREEKQTKLQDMVQSRQALQAQVDSLRTEKEAAEQPEQEAKDAHKKSWEESREAEKVEMDKQRSLEVFTELDQDSDGMLAGVELLSHPELDVDGDGAMSDQEAQSLLGGASSVDVSSFQESVWPQIQEKYKSETDALPVPPIEQPTESHPEVPEDDDDEEEGDDGEDDEEEEPEEDIRVPPSKAQEAEPEMPPYDETTQALIDAAQKARSQYEEAEKSLHDMEDTIKRLEKEISLDFGPSGEFSYLYGECYELSTSEYVYSLCPFNRVTQKPKHGGSETNLGSWGSWAGPEDNKFSSMKYEHGTSCWQGPNRSTQVKLSCGKDTVVTSTSEPSRCEYLMEFFTPAACHPPPEALPGDHDEL